MIFFLSPQALTIDAGFCIGLPIGNFVVARIETRYAEQYCDPSILSKGYP